MRACAFEEIRSAMTKHGYYVDGDSMCIKKRKAICLTYVWFYLMPDPVRLTASVNFFIETRSAWYESREDAVMAGVDNFMRNLFIYSE